MLYMVGEPNDYENDDESPDDESPEEFWSDSGDSEESNIK